MFVIVKKNSAIGPNGNYIGGVTPMVLSQSVIKAGKTFAGKALEADKVVTTMVPMAKDSANKFDTAAQAEAFLVSAELPAKFAEIEWVVCEAAAA